MDEEQNEMKREIFCQQKNEEAGPFQQPVSDSIDRQPWSFLLFFFAFPSAVVRGPESLFLQPLDFLDCAFPIRQFSSGPVWLGASLGFYWLSGCVLTTWWVYI